MPKLLQHLVDTRASFFVFVAYNAHAKAHMQAECRLTGRAAGRRLAEVEHGASIAYCDALHGTAGRVLRCAVLRFREHRVVADGMHRPGASGASAGTPSKRCHVPSAGPQTKASSLSAAVADLRLHRADCFLMTVSHRCSPRGPLNPADDQRPGLWVRSAGITVDRWSSTVTLPSRARYFHRACGVPTVCPPLFVDFLNPSNLLERLVGMAGFEPATP